MLSSCLSGGKSCTQTIAIESDNDCNEVNGNQVRALPHLPGIAGKAAQKRKGMEMRMLGAK
jgi:hypothetical protein